MAIVTLPTNFQNSEFDKIRPNFTDLVLIRDHERLRKSCTSERKIFAAMSKMGCVRVNDN